MKKLINLLTITFGSLLLAVGANAAPVPSIVSPSASIPAINYADDNTVAAANNDQSDQDLAQAQMQNQGQGQDQSQQNNVATNDQNSDDSVYDDNGDDNADVDADADSGTDSDTN